jgi:Single-strand binding protein family
LSFVTEHTPLPYQAIDPTSEQETPPLAHPLEAAPIPVYDAAFGQGELYTSAAYPATLALFQAGAIFTYEAADRTITMRVNHRGDVIFPAPGTAPEAVEPPRTTETVATYPNLPLMPEPARPDRSTMPQEHPQQRQQSKREHTEQDEKKKVILTGNIATTPSFKQTGKGLMVKFSLAVHPDIDTTEYHDVVAFGARAEKLKDALAKGDAVNVVGKQIMWQPQPTKGKPLEPKPAILLWQLSRGEKKTGA